MYFPKNSTFLFEIQPAKEIFPQNFYYTKLLNHFEFVHFIQFYKLCALETLSKKVEKNRLNGERLNLCISAAFFLSYDCFMMELM